MSSVEILLLAVLSNVGRFLVHIILPAHCTPLPPAAGRAEPSSKSPKEGSLRALGERAIRLLRAYRAVPSKKGYRAQVLDVLANLILCHRRSQEATGYKGHNEVTAFCFLVFSMIWCQAPPAPAASCDAFIN